jgi:hypothetical protein
MSSRNVVRLMGALSLCMCANAFSADAPQTDVANEGGIRDKWTLAPGAKLATPAYPDGFADAQRDVCIALGYQIGADGKTSDFRVLKQWNSQTQAIEPVDGFWSGFANAGADAVGQWQFQPRPEVAMPAPVYTVATLTWQTRKDTNPVTLRNRCKIDDLVVFMRNDSDKKGLNDHIIDRTARARDDRIQTFAGTPKNQPGMKP